MKEDNFMEIGDLGRNTDNQMVQQEIIDLNIEFREK